MCIESKIENLKEKLNTMIENSNKNELNRTDILAISKKLDKLIIKYYLEHRR